VKFLYTFKFKLFFVLFCVITLLISALVGTLLYTATSNQKQREQIQEKSAIEFLSTRAKHALFLKEYTELQHTIEELSQGSPIEQAVLVNQQNQVVISLDYRLLGKTIKWSEFKDKNWRQIPIESLTGQVGTLALRFSHTSTQLQLDILIKRTMQLTIPILAFIFLIAWFLARGLTRRLGNITFAIHKVNSGDFNFDIAISGQDEFAQLASSFKTMGQTIRDQLTQLTENERKLSRLIASSNDCIKELDLDGNLLSMSEGGQNLLEIDDISPYVNTSWVDLWKGEDREAALAAIAKVKEGERGIFTGYCETEKKVPKWWDTIITPIYQANGELESLLAISRDITDRKHAETEHLELEAQLSQKHKMEAVGYLAGGMAHNFNNNLSIILGNLELAQMKQSSSSEAIPLLKNAKIAVLRSRDLVKKIITYSCIEKQALTQISLQSIVNETVSLLKSTLPSTIRLQQSTQPGRDSIMIHADASQIQEVLLNLCNNAVHAMGEQGDLMIAVELAELGENEIPALYEGEPGCYAKLSVQDSGCGIPPEILDKLFDPFFSTKEEHEGAGMGLATVQGIVAQHSGFIKVNSVPDQGSVFALYFPAFATETPERVEEQQVELPRGEEHILFIDDDTMLASLGEEMLLEMGYRVTMMTDSQEALKLFNSNPNHFDLVITDQTMPKLTGADLIQELKRIKPDILTILSTGFSSLIDEDKAKEQGISAFLMKPLEMPKLAQTIRRVLDKN
jgi:PAS domain S-box-containing protein